MIDKFVRSPNYRPGRSKAISAIVVHYTGSMKLAGTVEWFENPASKVSAHYVIGRDGTIVQMVRDEDQAWHAGRSAMRPDLQPTDPRAEPNVNSFSLGIELVATPDSGFEEPQMVSLLGLLVLLITKYKVRPARVVGHSTIAPGRKIDPEGYKTKEHPDGRFDWPRTRAAVEAAFAQATA